LYEDKQVEKISREAGEKLGIRADLIEIDLSKLTDLLDEYREESLTQTLSEGEGLKTAPLTTAEQNQCISFLKQANLIKRFNEQIEKAGITGEDNNRIFLFVIATSYKMPDTLHALIQGSSGSGKTYLSRQITDLMPKEDVIRLTRVTESSFYNYGEYEIQHKLIALEDVDGLKEEAEFAFRELQSNGEIISSTSTKDEGSGQIKAQIKRVRGPIGSIATTTRGEIYEDNMSRIFLLAVDESKAQTNRIIQYQNQKSAGMINKTEERETKAFIQNCIRMLKPYEVINPYANKILLPQEAHKIRRLTELYHAFINQTTLLNQYQRQKDSQGRLITEKEDIQTAIEIMFESIILKIDELDGSLRQFYEDLKGYIMKQGEEYQNFQFTQIEIRQALNIKKTRLAYNLNELVELEYIYQYGHSNRGYSYKIIYWDNLLALRNRIKNNLNKQLENL
jgi:energy-coupling factor transporter ATP-binding protein EcfA2